MYNPESTYAIHLFTELKLRHNMKTNKEYNSHNQTEVIVMLQSVIVCPNKKMISYLNRNSQE
jgi:hypothetical protein